METVAGLIKWVVTSTLELLKEENSKYSEKFNRIDTSVATALQSLAPLMRPVKEGITSMTFATFAEWKSVVVVFLPAVALLLDSTGVEETVSAYLRFRAVLRLQSHTGSTLEELEQRCKELKTLMITNFTTVSKSQMNFPKFHNIEHAQDSIFEFGPVDCTSAQLEERAHQANTKTAWKSTNKRDAEEQMGKYLQEEETLRKLIANDSVAITNIDSVSKVEDGRVKPKQTGARILQATTPAH